MRPEQVDGFPETGVISPARMRAVDANAIALGVTALQMMESAGRALAESAHTTNPGHVLILCGRGNNGGDGMVAARHLQHAADTYVCYLDLGQKNSACAHQLAALSHCRVGLHPFTCRDDLLALQSLFEKADVIVDALLGTGQLGHGERTTCDLRRDGKRHSSQDYCSGHPDAGDACRPDLCLPQSQS